MNLGQDMQDEKMSESLLMPDLLISFLCFYWSKVALAVRFRVPREALIGLCQVLPMVES